MRRPAPLRRLIRSSLGTRFGPNQTPQTFELAQDRVALAAGRVEHADGERFFGFFEGNLRRVDLAGLEVLDLGCGYGGRTVYYAQAGAAHVEGVEINEEVVARGAALARALSCSNVRFRVGFAERLRYEDARFDTVVSFDVIEHVADPRAALAEIARVLRPDGNAWLVFPTYLGARASHLDYLTRVPALHRVFDPDVIVAVVNEFLSEDPERFGTPLQPAPRVTALGRRPLPGLNGLRASDLARLLDAAGLVTLGRWITPAVAPTDPVPGAAAVAAGLRALERRLGLPELLIGSIALHLRPAR